jgi:hypothetical protein
VAQTSPSILLTFLAGSSSTIGLLIYLIGGSLEECKNVNIAMDEISANTWNKAVEHVKKVEDSYWLKDALFDVVVDPLVIPNDDDDDSDEEDEDYDNDDGLDTEQSANLWSN